ncbi:hypothetical protein IV500_07495 [Paeniglutamicibacter antarcticus]|uniref:Uncharacterized protein n=1 Tax=Arthrobacter terrae TaxID=2935737 RepID=A0A931CJ19_9MICC|nr:hypothetical protein [Arthrobacter terrae]MBG0739233.1 hypothetical protein [Arthrobacter terrae]
MSAATAHRELRGHAAGAGSSETFALLPEAVRLFTGFAGLGAAAVTFGLSSNLVAAAVQEFGPTASESGSTTAASALGLVAAVIVGAWALCLLLWAIATLRNGSPVWPLLTGRLLPAAVTLQLGAIIYGLWQLPAANRTFDLSSACSVVLELAILGSVGWLRRGGDPAGWTAAEPSESAPIKAPPAGRLLAAMFAAALLVAAVATPGLAATTAGLHAVPHGEHGTHSPSLPALHDPAGHHH